MFIINLVVSFFFLIIDDLINVLLKIWLYIFYC